MLELFDRLLKCLGLCHRLQISPDIAWEYTIGATFPTARDLMADRLYCHASIVSVASRSQTQIAVFRFVVWGGVGSVGFLVAEDVKQKIIDCSKCRIRDFDMQLSASPFPKKNSDQDVPIAVLSFKVVR